jgi:hypothetical protein
MRLSARSPIAVPTAGCRTRARLRSLRAEGFALDRLASAAVSPSSHGGGGVGLDGHHDVLTQSHPNILNRMNANCILMAVMSLSFVTDFVSPYFRRVTCTRRSGMLEKLSAGTAMINARAKLYLVSSARLMFFMFGTLAILCFMFMFAEANRQF